MMNALRVALPILLMVGAAHAQTADELTIDLTGNFSEGNRLIGLEDCDSRLNESLTVEGELTATYADYTLRLEWTTGSGCDPSGVSCGSSQSEGDDRCGCLNSGTGTTVTDTTSVAELFPSICTLGVGTFTMQFSLVYVPDDGSTVSSESIDITFDFDPPAAPTDTPQVSSVDGALLVGFEGVESGNYEVCYVLTGVERCAETSDTSYRLTGLENGQAYTVYYRILDAAGNASGNSPSEQGTPVESSDFAEFYSAIPGQAEGCDARPGSAPTHWLWALVPLLALRRRRLGVVMTVAVAAVLIAPAAWANDVKETARDSSFEFRIGSYLPNIDNEFGDACDTQNCPYATIFDNDDPLMLLFSYNRHLLTNAGTLSFGGGMGYWNNDAGRAVRTEPGVSPVQFAEDKTEISVYPLFLELGYRLDLWQDIVPLVPALRVGLDGYAWRIFDGNGDVARFEDFETGNDTGEAAGISYGWHAAFGVHILLDYFAPGMAADFDRDAGVNNSYLTIDYQVAQVSNFGGGKTLWLGGDVLLIGLGLDM